MSSRPVNPLHDLPPWDGNEYDREVRAERAKQQPAPIKGTPRARTRLPQPIYQPTFGTWLMKFRHKGRDYRERFPTEREAIAYRDRMMKES